MYIRGRIPFLSKMCAFESEKIMLDAYTRPCGRCFLVSIKQVKMYKLIAPNWSTDKQLTSTTNQNKSRNSEIPVQDNNFLRKRQHSPQRSTRWWSTKCQSFWKLSGTIRISNWQRWSNTATSLEKNCTQKCDIFLKPIKTTWLRLWVLS